MISKLAGITKALSLGEGKFDPIAFSELLTSRIPMASENVRRRILDVMLNVGIPFNRWLGLRVHEISADHVTIKSPETVLRRNHVGTAHACAQALIGEYAAGLVIAQQFPIETYRMIISKLEIDYAKPGRGTLYGTAKAPETMPELTDEEGWVDMETRITDKAGDEVSVCRTRWQVKSWAKIARQKAGDGK